MIQHLIEIPGAPKPVGAYSAAVKANGFVFVSGQIALDPKTGSMISGDVEAEARQVLENLRTVLEGSGSSPEQILMTTIFLADISSSKKVNELYSAFIEKNSPPARQTLAVKDLPLGAKVEISVIAVSEK